MQQENDEREKQDTELHSVKVMPDTRASNKRQEDRCKREKRNLIGRTELRENFKCSSKCYMLVLLLLFLFKNIF